MHWVTIWQWLVANGLFRDVLATCIGLGAAKLMTVRVVREHKQNQAQIADLLDTKTPGGLRDVLEAVKDEPEDPTPDSDDGEDDGDGEEEEERRKRRHGTSSGHSSQEGHPGHHADSPAPAPDHDKPAPDTSFLTHFRPGHGR